MRIRFWGVRGSLPSPQLSFQIQEKISAIIAQMLPSDLETPESRKQFIASIPPWLFGTVGGNTSCVSLSLENDPNELIVFDAGSGLRELGLAIPKTNPEINKYHMFFSHCHWDHLMGLPFFNPAYHPKMELSFYSPRSDLENVLSFQMSNPYFPVTMEVMGSKKTFSVLPPAPDKISISNAVISYKKMNHPGDSHTYMVNDNKHRFIYATDVELSAEDFTNSNENIAFFQNADLAVIDSQYTLKDAVEKYNWGHTSFSVAIDFAVHWKIRRLVLFHHEPNYDDGKLYNILQSAKWYAERMKFKDLEIILATEGLEITLL